MRAELLRLTIGGALLAGAALAGAQSRGLPTVIEGANPDIWTGKADQGPIVHRATEVAFPEQLSGMKQFRVVALGGPDDVTINYRIGETTFSIFLFKPGALPEHRLPESITAVGARSPQAFVWANGPFDVDAPQKLRLFKGTYKTGIGPDTVMDYLYFGALGAWTVKIRATLPAPKVVEDEQRLDAAVRALPWAAIEQANGACAGSACQPTRTMPFDHHIGEMMLGRLLKATGEKGRPDDDKALLSRRIGNHEWAVQPLDEKLAPLFSKGFGGLTVTAPLYTLSLRAKGKEAAIVRFFSGTPDEQLFARTVDALERTPEETPFVPPAVAARYVVE